MTPVSASLQSDLNSTDKSRRNVDTNSLIEKLQINNKNAEKVVTNKTPVNSINDSIKSLQTNPNEKLFQKDQILNNTQEILEHIQKEQNITIINDDNDILGTMFRITTMKDLKPGDIVSYQKKVPNLIKNIPIYILITSTKTVDITKYYYYMYTNPDNTNQTINDHKTEGQLGKLLDISDGLLVFRADPSLYNNVSGEPDTIKPTDDLTKLLNDFGAVSTLLETDGFFEPSKKISEVKDVMFVIGCITGPLSVILGPYNLYKMAKELKSKCSGTRSAEEVALLRTNDLMYTQVNRISELTRTMDTIRLDLGRLEVSANTRLLNAELDIIQKI